MQRLMAHAALRAADTGNPEHLIGADEAEALCSMIGTRLGFAAINLYPLVVDFDPDELTLVVSHNAGADTSLVFRVLEAALAASLDGCETEFLEMLRAARRLLGAPPFPRIEPH